MGWWEKSEKIPDTKDFLGIIKALVFESPVSIKKGSKKENTVHYDPVSTRKCSFRERGIVNGYLNSILSKIRTPLAKNNAYHVLAGEQKVAEKVRDIEKTSHLGDKNFEFIVMRKRYDMSDTEAVYYYIRNAFAHGSFGTETIDDRRIYYLESKKGDEIKAQIRLQEKTLKSYCELAHKTKNSIIDDRANRSKRSKRKKK